MPTKGHGQLKAMFRYFTGTFPDYKTFSIYDDIWLVILEDPDSSFVEGDHNHIANDGGI